MGENVFKKVLITGMSVLTLSLAGCGVSPEEKLSGAYQELLDAKSYEKKTTITFNADKTIDSDLQKSLSYLNVQMTSEARTDNKLIERDYRIHTEDDELLTRWITEIGPDQNKSYIRTEDFYESLDGTNTRYQLEIPTEFKETILLVTSGKSEGIEIGKTEDAFDGTVSEKGDELQLLITKDNHKDDLFEMIRMEMGRISLSEMSGEFSYLVGLIRKSNIDIGDVNYIVELKDGQLKEESYVLPVHFIENGEVVAAMDINVEVEYEKIDQPINFNYDWKKAKIVEMEAVKKDTIQQIDQQTK